MTALRWIVPAALAALALGVGTAEAATVTPISKAQRDLVIVSPDLSQGDELEQGLYDVIEAGGVGLGVGTLSARYRSVHVLRNDGASRAAFVGKLRELTARAGTRAVDVIFLSHGLDDRVLLAEGLMTVASIRASIVARLSTAQRAKLRMLFSTACFGASHRAAWIGAGFKAVSGSRLIYADSAVSYSPFLSSWGIGATFGTAVTAANLAGEVSPWDGIAKAWLRSRNYTDWSRVDSYRVTSGNAALTISTMP
jgi:hypothetical protein